MIIDFLGKEIRKVVVREDFVRKRRRCSRVHSRVNS